LFKEGRGQAMNILLGYSADGRPVEVSEEQLAHHLYMLGRSGMGKTTCLCNICLALMDVKPKVGLCVIDPLGALVEVMKRRIPDYRTRDVILFEARDREHPFALNPLAPKPREDMLGQWASHVMSVFQLMCEDGEWNSRTKQTLRNIIITLVSRNTKGGPLGEDWPAALDEVSPILTLQAEDDGDRRKWWDRGTPYRKLFYSTLEEGGHIPVLRFWRDLYDKVMTLRPKAEVSAAIGGNTDQHMANPIVRNTVGQTQTKINFLDVMNEGKILLVDLSGIGDESANFLGSVVMAQLASATLQRDAYAEPHFYIVADELYRYGNEAFRYISRQGRNFNVHLIAAQQDQTDMRPWQRGLMGNASNRVYFQLVPSDALEQAHEFDTTPPAPEPDMRPVYVPYSMPEADIAPRHPSNLAHAYIQGTVQENISLGRRIVSALEEWITAGYEDSDKKGLILGSLDNYVSWLHLVASNYQPSPANSDFMDDWVAAAKDTEVEGWARTFVDRHPELDEVGNSIEKWKCAASSMKCSKWMAECIPPQSVLASARDALDLQERTFAEYGVYAQQPAWTEAYDHLVLTGHLFTGDPCYREITSTSQGPTLYQQVRGRPRAYSDVYQQIANELTHLPRQHAKCKLAALGDARPTEVTIKTAPLEAENPRWRENWRTVKKRSRKNYTRPVDEVEEEAGRRDRIMRRALETWHAGDGGSREYHGDDPSLGARSASLPGQR